MNFIKNLYRRIYDDNEEIDPLLKLEIEAEFKQLKQEFKELKRTTLTFCRYPGNAKERWSINVAKYGGVYRRRSNRIEICNTFSTKELSTIAYRIVLLHEIRHAIQAAGSVKGIAPVWMGIRHRDPQEDAKIRKDREIDADHFMIKQFDKRYRNLFLKETIIKVMEKTLKNRRKFSYLYDPAIVEDYLKELSSPDPIQPIPI